MVFHESRPSAVSGVETVHVRERMLEHAEIGLQIDGGEDHGQSPPSTQKYGRSRKRYNEQRCGTILAARAQAGFVSLKDKARVCWYSCAPLSGDASHALQLVFEA